MIILGVIVLCALRTGSPRGEGEAPHGAAGDVVGLSGSESFCNGNPGFGKQEPRTWNLPPSTQSMCYNNFHGSANGMDVPRGGRNWCWVARKRNGCHARLAYRLSWQELDAIAFQTGAPDPPEKFFPLLEPEMCDAQAKGATRTWTADEWAAAHQWLSENVKVFVLNLRMNKERWMYMSARLKELHIEAERVDGVDMRVRDALGSAKEEGLIPEGFDLERAKGEAWKVGLNGILGRVGCASAHFRAQRAAINGGRPLAVVFEDDVWPEQDFVPRLWELVHEELPCDWEAVSLSSKCPYGRCISQHLSRVQPDGNEPEASCHGGVNYGFQAVLYHVERLEDLQKRWRQVVFDEGRPHCLDIDVALASISHEVNYYAVPFVQAPGFLSEIHYTSSRETLDSESKVGVETAACSTHEGCQAFVGDCCPTPAGPALGCCRAHPNSCGGIESGVDFVVDGSFGYSVNEVSSPDDCCKHCQKEQQCKAWTWVKDAGLNSLNPGQCWLKGGNVVNKVPKVGVVSGFPSTPVVSDGGDDHDDIGAPHVTSKEARLQVLRALTHVGALEVTEVMQGGAMSGRSAELREAMANNETLAKSCTQILADMEYEMAYAGSWAVHADHVPSPGACCGLCNSEPFCLSWTFVEDAKLAPGFPSQCWLKGGNISGIAHKKGIISGLRG